MKRIFHEHVSMKPGEDDNPSHYEIKSGEDIPCDSVQNPADPDASYNARRGQGYLVQVMESYAEDEGDEKDSSRPDIITHVSVGKMTVNDSSSLVPAIEDAYSRGLAPEAVAADSHCGSLDRMDYAADQGVELVAPAMPPRGYKTNRLGLNIFRCAAALRAA